MNDDMEVVLPSSNDLGFNTPNIISYQDDIDEEKNKVSLKFVKRGARRGDTIVSGVPVKKGWKDKKKKKRYIMEGDDKGNGVDPKIFLKEVKKIRCCNGCITTESQLEVRALQKKRKMQRRKKRSNRDYGINQQIADAKEAEDDAVVFKFQGDHRRFIRDHLISKYKFGPDEIVIHGA